MISLFISLGMHFTENIYLIMQFKPEEKSGRHLIFSLCQNIIPYQGNFYSPIPQTPPGIRVISVLLISEKITAATRLWQPTASARPALYYCHASLQVAQFITEGFSVPFVKITECKIQRAENNVILGTFLKRFRLVPVLLQILENTHL